MWCVDKAEPLNLKLVRGDPTRRSRFWFWFDGDKMKCDAMRCDALGLGQVGLGRVGLGKVRCGSIMR